MESRRWSVTELVAGASHRWDRAALGLLSRWWSFLRAVRGEAWAVYGSLLLTVRPGPRLRQASTSEQGRGSVPALLTARKVA
jgi:hypothetical protein